MILGQTRTPFEAPGMPHAKLPHTAFYSGNIWPFSEVTNRMRAYPMYRPPLVPGMGPQMLPPVPPPAPPAPNGAPAAATQVPSSAPTSAAMHGSFGGAGFGSTGGTKAHFHVDPYMVMRSGWIPGVSPSGSNIRAGVHNAGARIHRSMPFQTAPLPPDMPPPAPMPAPMPAATHGFGRPHKRRHWLSRLINPETVSEIDTRAASGGCETYPPRADGIKVTVCNGRVTKYEDAQGNVNTPDPNSGVEYGSGSGMGGFGHHGHHHHHHHAAAIAAEEQQAMAGLGHHHHHHHHAAAMAGLGFPGWGNRWGNRGGVRPGFNPGFRPPVYGTQPGFEHRRHHWWQPAYVPPPPAAPAFGRW
jgi:hypothetical protein